MGDALDRREWDVVISDYSLPNFNAPAALELLKRRGLDLPFIIISGTAGEEAAVAAMRAGAHDFLAKGGFARLVPVIERESREAEHRRERRRAEESLRGAYQRLTFHFENTPLAVIEWDGNFCVTRWSPSAERLFGWKAEEVVGRCADDWRFVFADDAQAVKEVEERQRRGADGQGVSRNRNYAKDGSVLYCEWYNSALYDESGNLMSVLSLVLDVTARTLAEQDRARLLEAEQSLRAEAERANRLKDEFLATLSHELRTPLTSILGWAHLLQAGDMDHATSVRALEAIQRNARSQVQLIEDLLDVSRVITGKLRLEVRPINLANVIEAAIEAVRPAADARRVQLVATLDAQTTIPGDPDRLQQVVWNLLSNSIKFTRAKGRVEVSLTQSNGEAQIVIKDTGIGISPQFLPFVFDRFRQADSTSTRAYGGLGLGLALVRHLVEQHGGAVSATSPGHEQGSTFTITLPLARPQVMGQRAQAVRFADYPSSDSYDAHALHNLRVLVVDDEEDTRDLLQTVLAMCGARVTTTASVPEAMAAIERERPHVMVCDIGMPGEDGYQLISRVRALPFGRGGSTPAVALTACAREEDRRRALDAGYQVHVSKPIKPSELVAVVAGVAGQTGTD
jgi:PAS domain S-box-containing protein